MCRCLATISDFFVLSDAADALDRLIERIRNETLCICPSCGGRGSENRGITLGVALMENMQPQPNMPMSETVRLFAETLRKQWGLGHCDDDILLLISTRDHQSHTLVGPAVADVFPQEVADQIYLESRGHFSNCLFYQGLESMVQSYFDMLRRLQAKGPVGQRHSGNAGPSAGLIVGIVFGVLALMMLVAGTLFFLVNRCGDAGNFPGKNASDPRRKSSVHRFPPGPTAVNTTIRLSQSSGAKIASTSRRLVLVRLLFCP
ncbi:uncharacterized protein ISCGN_004043 [Ixodes scapularis]